MYYNNKKLILSIVELVIGSILIVLGIKGKIDSTLWSGAGGGATHVALRSGLLSSLENYKNELINHIEKENILLAIV